MSSFEEIGKLTIEGKTFTMAEKHSETGLSIRCIKYPRTKKKSTTDLGGNLLEEVDAITKVLFDFTIYAEKIL